jgi:hypothetical protein
MGHKTSNFFIRFIGCHFVTAVAVEVKVNFDEFEIHKIIQTFGRVREPL